MKRLLVVDDHEIVRKGLRHILLEAGENWVVEEAGAPDEALPRIQGDQVFDAVLVDISMPGRGGLDLLKDIRTLRPSLPVLMLTMYDEEQYAVRALRLGAMGYVMKTMAAEELVMAVRAVVAGRRYVTPAVAEKLVQYLGRDTDGPLHAHLSNREFQVMCLIGFGRTVSEIAEELALSVKTVSTYRCRILAKLHMQTNAEITRYCVTNSIGP